MYNTFDFEIGCIGADINKFNEDYICYEFITFSNFVTFAYVFINGT